MSLEIQESHWPDALSRSLSLVAAKSPWIIWLLFVKSDFLNLVFFTKHLSNEKRGLPALYQISPARTVSMKKV